MSGKKANFISSDPQAEASIQLLGGETFEGVAFSRGQLKALEKLYGFTPEKPGTLEAAGARRNLMRHLQKDGLRVMAVLAQWCESGQDPVKVIVQLAFEAGYDTSGLCDWADDDE